MHHAVLLYGAIAAVPSESMPKVSDGCCPVCSSLATAMGNADAVISAIGGSGDSSTYHAVDNEVILDVITNMTECLLNPCLTITDILHSSLCGDSLPCASAAVCRWECRCTDCTEILQGNVALVDAALQKNISKFVLMSSLLANGKEAGQALNPGTGPPMFLISTICCRWLAILLRGLCVGQ